MLYIELEKKLDTPNNTQTISLIKNFLDDKKNRDALNGEQLANLLDYALKTKEADLSEIFLTHPELNDKYLTLSLQILLKSDPAGFAKASQTNPLSKSLLERLLQTLEPLTYLNILPSLSTLSYAGESGKPLSYPFNLEGLLQALTEKHALNLKKGPFNCIPYQNIDNPSFFKDLFNCMAGNVGLRDDLYQRLEKGYPLDRFGFLFQNSALLTKEQLHFILDVPPEKQAIFFKRAWIHGFAFKIINSPDDHLNLIMDTALSHPDVDVKRTAIANLLAYAGNHKKDNQAWLQQHLTDKYLLPLAPKGDETVPFLKDALDTYWGTKPTLVRVLLDKQKTMLPFLDKEGQNKSDEHSIIIHLFNNISPADLPTLMAFPRVKTFLEERDLLRSLLQIVRPSKERVQEIISSPILIQSLFQEPTELDENKEHSLYHPIETLMQRAALSDMDALCALPRIKAYYTHQDILPSLLKRASFEFETLIQHPSIKPFIQGAAIYKAKLPPEQMELILDDVELKAGFQLAKERELVKAIFNPQWDKLGVGFFSHKTPRHIKKMRHELGNKKEEVTFPLGEQYDKLISLAYEASVEAAGCFGSHRHPKVQDFYDKTADTQATKPFAHTL